MVVRLKKKHARVRRIYVRQNAVHAAARRTFGSECSERENPAGCWLAIQFWRGRPGPAHGMILSIHNPQINGHHIATSAAEPPCLRTPHWFGTQETRPQAPLAHREPLVTGFPVVSRFM